MDVHVADGIGASFGQERWSGIFVLARQKGARATLHLAAIFRMLSRSTTGAQMSKLLKGAVLPIAAGIIALVAATVLVILFMVHPETQGTSPPQAKQPPGGEPHV